MSKKSAIVLFSLILGVSLLCNGRTHTYNPVNGADLDRNLREVSNHFGSWKQDTVFINLRDTIYDLGTHERNSYNISCHFVMRGPTGVEESEMPVIMINYKTSSYFCFFNIGDMNYPIRNYGMKLENFKIVVTGSFRPITNETVPWQIFNVAKVDGSKMRNVTLDQQYTDRLTLADFPYDSLIRL